MNQYEKALSIWKSKNIMLVLLGHPPITIHEEDRKEYYSALDAWNSNQELDPMCDFLRGQTVKTWEKQIARACQCLC